MKLNKKYKIAFLNDKKNNWFAKYLKNYKKKIAKKYSSISTYNFKKIKNKHIVFIINYTKILPLEFLKKNLLNLVIHSSDLPKDRGFAPLNYQILRGKKTIKTCLISAEKKVDTGNIFLKETIRLNGSELANELRKKQAKAMIKILNKFLKLFPKVKSYKQIGKPTFNKRRTKFDSKININKTIKSQFNLLRISDNDKYPCYFNYKKHRYILKIYKENINDQKQ